MVPGQDSNAAPCELASIRISISVSAPSFAIPVYAALAKTRRSANFRHMETLNARARHIVVAVVAALLIAGVLRHVLHVHVGYSREEIRAGAFIGFFGVLAVWLALIRFKSEGESSK